ncbi:MAG: acyltransferase [Usitatibacter sp.]
MIGYLWSRRSSKPLFSRQWFVAWAKRILTFPAVLSALAARFRVTGAGMAVGDLSFVHPLRLTGKRKLMSVGAHTVVGQATIALLAKLTIGSHVVINDAVTVLTASHKTDSPEWESVSEEVVIEDYAWIAYGATIMPGVRIGRGAVVGAFSVVRTDVPAYQIFVGNPATATGRMRPQELTYDPVMGLAFVRAWLA